MPVNATLLSVNQSGKGIISSQSPFLQSIFILSHIHHLSIPSTLFLHPPNPPYPYPYQPPPTSSTHPNPKIMASPIQALTPTATPTPTSSPPKFHTTLTTLVILLYITTPCVLSLFILPLAIWYLVRTVRKRRQRQPQRGGDGGKAKGEMGGDWECEGGIEGRGIRKGKGEEKEG